MRYCLAVVLVVIIGCADKRSESRDQIEQGPPPRSAAEALTPGPGRVVPPEIPVELQELRSEVQSSNNVVKNDIQGIGVQVGHIAEKVQGFGGDLLRVQNQMKADVHSEIQTTFGGLDAKLTAQATAIATLAVDVRSLAQANLAIAAKVEQTSQTISAGRDSHTQTINFSKEMVEVIRSENRVQFYTTLAFTILTIALVMVLTEVQRRALQGVLLYLMEKEKRQ